VRGFADLYDALDATTSTLAKVEAMAAYFREAPPEDAAWALYFLTGRRLKRLVPARLLDEWTLSLTGLPPWLAGECYDAVGDFAEAIALLVDGAVERRASEDVALGTWIERLLHLAEVDPAEQRALVAAWWSELPRRELYLFVKLVTGELRVGVSDTLVVRALSKVTGLEPRAIAHRLMGTWEPSADFFRGLVSKDTRPEDVSRPYPFFLASPLDRKFEELGDPSEWLVEWKWDGIRGQLIHRQGEVFLWSRGEELITHRFPEVEGAGRKLPPGTVLDGEVLAYAGGAPLPFSRLQHRIGRQKLTPRILAEAPVVFMAFDLLEEEGRDVRDLPLSERRRRLEALIADRDPALKLSPRVDPAAERPSEPYWAALGALRDTSRERNVEGFLLKRLASAYGSGRKKGDWWKWKVDPFTIDAVLIYAQPGHGRRATLFTDYTFALWDKGELVPVAKAYSGLSDEEIDALDRWIRAHTLERFGPVRRVEPSQVFELHFEGIARSGRHRSGIAVRFPRIHRWRTDKPAAEADAVQSLEALLP